MPTQSFLIPFDIASLWREGCSGGGWWFDRCGQAIELLIAEDGDTLVAPVNPAAAWRIFADPCGRAWQLTGWPARGRTYRCREATAEFGRILAGAIMTAPASAEAIRTFAAGIAAGGGPHAPSLPEGMEIALPADRGTPLRIAFVDRGLRLTQGAFDLTIDTLPIASLHRSSASGASLRRIAEPTQLADARGRLRSTPGHAGTAAATAIAIALAAIDRAEAMQHRVEALERSLRRRHHHQQLR